MILTRWHYGPDCTLGWLEHDGLKLATIERPWLANPAGVGGMPRQSCIPDGEYRIEPFTGSRFTDVFRLSNPDLGVYPDAVPAGQRFGRHSILIHAGNFVEDVIGCVAVGSRHTITNSAHQVTLSRDALLALREAMRVTPEQTLTIRPFGGTSS
jgi:hypothetical protein